MALRLETPGAEHRGRYEEMMEEWEGYSGRLNPGAMRRRSEKHPEPISYEAWMAWLEEDREAGQELFFLVETETGRLLGGISIRTQVERERLYLDGHSGYGIRPSERRKGYASRMLKMALPILWDRGTDPVVITCAKGNTGSAKAALAAGGVLVWEGEGEEEGEVVQAYELKRG